MIQTKKWNTCLWRCRGRKEDRQWQSKFDKMSITRISERGIFMSVFHYICSFLISLKWYQNKRLQKQNYTIDVQTIFYIKNPQGGLEKLAWFKVSENEHCSFKYLIRSVTQSCLGLWDPMDCSIPASLSITNSSSLLKLMSIKVVMPSNHLILCCPLLLLTSILPSTGVFSNESVLHIRWPKYWSFHINISPSNEYSGLISFRMDWLDVLAAQGTLKGLLQHHSSKASILWHSAFFMVQLSHPYMTTGETITLTRQTFVGKVTSLLSRLVIAFLPRSKRLLISWLQLPSAVILEPKKIKSVTVSTFSPSIFHEWRDWMPWS